MDVKHIKVGDVVKLKHGRGFLRVDQIVGTELREQADSPWAGGGGSVRWLDAELVEEVGSFVPRALNLPQDDSQPHCFDCTWICDAWHCTMNCSGRTARGVTKAIFP